MSKKWVARLLLVAFGCGVLFAYWRLGLGNILTFENLTANRESLNAAYREHPAAMIAAFAAIYIAATAVSLPGATLLTIAAGATFGLTTGTVLVSFASSIGATLAFLASRFLLRDFMQRRFGERLRGVEDGLKKEGPFYLLTLRLTPIFPFFLVNLSMGLTTIRAATFYWVSQIGMLPGTVLYVNAGTELAKIKSLREIMSLGMFFSFVLIGVLPLISKRIIDALKVRKRLKRFRRPKSFEYNMVVIGGGSAGLVSAYIAAAVKAKVALIEKHKMGGECLNTGCVPSKALIRSAKLLHDFARAKELGIEALPAKVKFSEIMERVHRVVSQVAPNDSRERYEGLGVECIAGTAIIRSPFEVEVNGRRLTTKNIVVATGASPLIPQLSGLNKIRFLTSDNVWDLRELPSNLVVLGGGTIGCELAQCFARFGSKVTIVDMAPRVLSREDPEVSAAIAAQFAREGIDVRVSHKAIRIDPSDNASENILVCDDEGKEVRFPFDQILVALGRKANVAGFGLEELGVEVSARGTLAADDFLSTTQYPNIFVCGDVTGPYQLTHAAAHQAWYVAVNALFSPFRKFKVDYRVIPWCTFTDPEVARVGLNEDEAKKLNVPYEVTRYDIKDLDRAIADGQARGFVKVLTEPGRDRILGALIVGDHAGDIISEYVSAMKHGLGMNKILGTIHIYPTFAEANKYAAGVWRKANAPKRALMFLARYHAWRRR